LVIRFFVIYVISTAPIIPPEIHHGTHLIQTRHPDPRHPEIIPEEIPEIIPEEIPEIIPEEIPEIIPEEIPEIIPEEVPEIIQKLMHDLKIYVATLVRILVTLVFDAYIKLILQSSTVKKETILLPHAKIFVHNSATVAQVSHLKVRNV
jgi:hypothetical protein